MRPGPPGWRSMSSASVWSGTASSAIAGAGRGHEPSSFPPHPGPRAARGPPTGSLAQAQGTGRSAGGPDPGPLVQAPAANGGRSPSRAWRLPAPAPGRGRIARGPAGRPHLPRRPGPGAGQPALDRRPGGRPGRPRAAGQRVHGEPGGGGPPAFGLALGPHRLGVHRAPRPGHDPGRGMAAGGRVSGGGRPALRPLRPGGRAGAGRCRRRRAAGGRRAAPAGATAGAAGDGSRAPGGAGQRPAAASGADRPAGSLLHHRRLWQPDPGRGARLAGAVRSGADPGGAGGAVAEGGGSPPAPGGRRELRRSPSPLRERDEPERGGGGGLAPGGPGPAVASLRTGLGGSGRSPPGDQFHLSLTPFGLASPWARVRPDVGPNAGVVPGFSTTSVVAAGAGHKILVSLAVPDILTLVAPGISPRSRRQRTTPCPGGSG